VCLCVCVCVCVCVVCVCVVCVCVCCGLSAYSLCKYTHTGTERRPFDSAQKASVKRDLLEC